jgi:serine/threonine protein kinase
VPSVANAVFADRYELKRLLGKGKRKRVYHAHDSYLRRDVALAVLEPSEVGVNLAHREAQLISRLGDHPNIVTIYDADVAEDGRPFIVSEYMEGGELGQYCERVWESQSELPIEEILRIGAQICHGLAHVHRHQIVHCDVAPPNIWLDSHHRVHLGDFDSAVPLDSEDAASEPTDDTTAAYRSPEQQAGDAVDFRSDLYSLGLVLYYLLTGRQPRKKQRRVVDVRPSTPLELDEIIGRLTAEDPDRRFSTAINVASALERLGSTASERSLETFLANGETSRVEFKASLRHVHEPSQAMSPSEQRKALETAVAKTIAAFLNTAGGTLLIGVDDKAEIIGIEADFASLHKKANLDGWQSAFKNVVSSRLGPGGLSLLDVIFEQRNSRTVALIEVPPRDRETWVDRQDFYVRLANSSEALTGPQLVAYVHEHWAA